MRQQLIYFYFSTYNTLLRWVLVCGPRFMILILHKMSSKIEGKYLEFLFFIFQFLKIYFLEVWRIRIFITDSLRSTCYFSFLSPVLGYKHQQYWIWHSGQWNYNSHKTFSYQHLFFLKTELCILFYASAIVLYHMAGIYLWFYLFHVILKGWLRQVLNHLYIPNANHSTKWVFIKCWFNEQMNEF